jgi:adenosylcobinamide-GDP ribazoletransferase
MTSGPQPVPNGFALAVSMFSIIPAPRRFLAGPDNDAALDRSQTTATLRWLPALGAILGALAGLTSVAVLYRDRSAGLLAAAIGVTALILLTGGLHLDGLADTVDGLASRAPHDKALEIMRRSDIGPFGVVAIVVVLLLDVAAVAVIANAGSPWRVLAGLMVAAVTGRLAAIHAGLPGVPAARDSGFGSLVAGSVNAATAGSLMALGLLVGAALAWLNHASIVGWPVAQVVALLLMWFTRRWLTTRLGGVTGDVFGALIEATTMLTLVGISLAR